MVLLLVTLPAAWIIPVTVAKQEAFPHLKGIDNVLPRSPGRLTFLQILTYLLFCDGINPGL